MFIGRENELQRLAGIINADLPKIGVIYGRRRIGKSELIKKAFEKKRMLIFEGLENRPKILTVYFENRFPKILVLHRVVVLPKF